jgi:hypothetical protein
MELLSVDDVPQDTFSLDRYLVYPFMSGKTVELAAKYRSLCDFGSEFSHEALITLQLEHVVGRFLILIFSELNHNMIQW